MQCVSEASWLVGWLRLRLRNHMKHEAAARLTKTTNDEDACGVFYGPNSQRSAAAAAAASLYLVGEWQWCQCAHSDSALRMLQPRTAQVQAFRFGHRRRQRLKHANNRHFDAQHCVVSSEISHRALLTP